MMRWVGVFIGAALAVGSGAGASSLHGSGAPVVHGSGAPVPHDAGALVPHDAGVRAPERVVPTLPSDAIEYHSGTLPLILTVPHGGTREPSDLPDRISGTSGRYDTNTLELGRSIAEALKKRTGRSPFLVINRVHRKKLDTNRDVLEAAQDDSLATALWEAWHACIDSAKRAVVQQFGAGLLVDLHGHRHREAWLELGYLLSGSDLERSDDSLNMPGTVNSSSIGGLTRFSPVSFAAIIRGPMSLGALFEDHGYESVPGPTHPHPGGKAYFSGGYNTERHGSLQGGTIVAIQLETPWAPVRDTDAHRTSFAEAAADVFAQYLEIHFAPHAE